MKTSPSNSKLLAVIFAVATMASITAHGAVNLIVNGSFEDPQISAGTFQIFPNIPGWYGDPNGIEIQNRIAGSPYDGNQLVELDTTANSGMVSQTVSTILGQTYTLSFVYSPRPGRPAGSNGIKASFNGVELVTLDGAGSSDTVWTLQNFTVTGTGSDTVRFEATGTSESYGGYLDAVSLVAVPEPSTYFAGGLLLIPFLVQARRWIRTRN